MLKPDDVRRELPEKGGVKVENKVEYGDLENISVQIHGNASSYLVLKAL